MKNQDIKIRFAEERDVSDLFVLNEKFNGQGVTDIASVEKLLAENNSEPVIVAESDDNAVGFLCVRIMRSFCYSESYAEITELFVDEQYRKRGLARAMIAFAEEFCTKNYAVHNFRILTGCDNIAALSLYRASGYVDGNETVFRKKL